eukprot:GHVN01010881.1.p1 GENE.GHVN01010881.1~~GHVN01010881.1.p1  ORF type:complete len:293 (+),score=23.70 GHVN01010881.1:2-880(+)
MEKSSTEESIDTQPLTKGIQESVRRISKFAAPLTSVNYDLRVDPSLIQLWGEQRPLSLNSNIRSDPEMSYDGMGHLSLLPSSTPTPISRSHLVPKLNLSSMNAPSPFPCLEPICTRLPVWRGDPHTSRDAVSHQSERTTTRVEVSHVPIEPTPAQLREMIVAAMREIETLEAQKKRIWDEKEAFVTANAQLQGCLVENERLIQTARDTSQHYSTHTQSTRTFTHRRPAASPRSNPFVTARSTQEPRALVHSSQSRPRCPVFSLDKPGAVTARTEGWVGAGNSIQWHVISSRY